MEEKKRKRTTSLETKKYENMGLSEDAMNQIKKELAHNREKNEEIQLLDKERKGFEGCPKKEDLYKLPPTICLFNKEKFLKHLMDRAEQRKRVVAQKRKPNRKSLNSLSEEELIKLAMEESLKQ
eukprot:snap_masked-scaffold_14-processed-gene-3.26-mRNA-1 protein AED:1.00 eAED:1.00 QI:0/0/0/0/1/1/3/0/123